MEENKTIENNDSQEEVVASQNWFKFADEEEYEQPETEEENVEESESEEDEEEEVVDPQEEEEEKKEQTPEENAQYRKMRLKAERDAKKKLEKQQMEYDLQRQQLEQMRIQLEQQEAERRIANEYLSPRKVLDKADQEGISEDQAEKMLRYEAERMISAEKMQVQERFNKRQEQKKNLMKDKYFALLEGEVDTLASQNPDVDYENIYYLLRGKKSDELEKKLASSVEKRTIANMQDRARRRSVSGSNAGGEEVVSPTTVLTDKGMRMANIFGNDPRDIAKYVKKHNTKKRG